MKQVFRRLLACIKVMLIGVTGYCQANITAAEYFFDADPGYGSGTPITISTPGTNIASLGFNANVASLTNGMHTLFIRTKNANGTWSNTNISHFAKVQLPGANPNTISNIAQAEYFF